MPPCQPGTQSISLSLNTSGDGGSTAPLGSPFQSLIAISGQEFLPTCDLKLAGRGGRSVQRGRGAAGAPQDALLHPGNGKGKGGEKDMERWRRQGRRCGQGKQRAAPAVKEAEEGAGRPRRGSPVRAPPAQPWP